MGSEQGLIEGDGLVVFLEIKGGQLHAVFPRLSVARMCV
jgi:hypothetical protein